MTQLYNTPPHKNPSDSRNKIFLKIPAVICGVLVSLSLSIPSAASGGIKAPMPDSDRDTHITMSPDPAATSGYEQPRRLYVKTNMPAWAMLWTNLAVEVDLSPHMSFNFPVYYSGFNYFTGHTKFRTLAFQPELRFWPKADNTGFFAGAHFGLGWYNVAFGGDHRYQDHDRNTPAMGGGISLGYRFLFCANKRWTMEASIGAGIYRLDYDVFQNHCDGLIIDRRKRTFYGIDQVNFSIGYQFDISGKGGKR